MKKRLIVFITLLLAGLFITIQQFSVQIMSTYEVHKSYSRSETPEVYLIPETLPISESSAIASTITNSTCIFSTPWANPTLERSSTNIVLYSYTNGVKIISLASGSSVFAAELLRRNIYAGNDKGDLEHFFGSSNMQSNFDFLNACYKTTPDTVSVFSSKTVALRKVIFLILKSVMIPSSNVDVCYRYDMNGKKGFQFGDPAKDNRVHLICFTSPNDAVELSVGCSKTTVSQKDINCILQSVRNNANHRPHSIAATGAAQSDP